MNVRELKERQQSYQIVDVREPYEWEVGRIDGSVLIPLNDILAGAEEGQLDRARPIAAVCKMGSRSELAALMLQARGYQAENLDGGLDEWEAEGFPLTAPDGSPGRSL